MKNSPQIIKILGIISLVIILSVLKTSIGISQGTATGIQGTSTSTQRTTTSTQATTSRQGISQTTIEIPNPVSHRSFEALLMAVLTFLQGVGAVIAVFALMAGAFKFMTAQGNPEKVKEGYQMIFWVLIGLFVIISARAFVEFLRRSLGTTR